MIATIISLTLMATPPLPERNPLRTQEPVRVKYCDRQDGYHKQQPCKWGEK